VYRGYDNKSTDDNFKIIDVTAAATDVLRGYIPNYAISVDGTTKTYYTPNVVVDSSGTICVASSPYTNLIQVYRNYSATNLKPLPTINISGNNMSYGQNIAINGTGTIVSTSTPYYNNNAGYFQKFTLANNTAIPINRYISNISTVTNYTTNQNSSNYIFKMNNQNILSTSYTNTSSIVNISTAIYNISFANNASLIDSYVTSSIINNANDYLLTLGGDPTITRVNVGGPGTTTIAIGGNALFEPSTGTRNAALGAYTSITGGASNSTVIGYGASTSESNQIVLGTSAETVNCPGKMNINAINSPITISNFTTPTSASQIGYIQTSEQTQGYKDDNVIGAVFEHYLYVTLIPGVWMIVGRMTLQLQSANVFAHMQVIITKGLTEANAIYSVGNSNSYSSSVNIYNRFQVTRIVRVLSSDTDKIYYLAGSCNPIGYGSEFDLYAVRIA